MRSTAIVIATAAIVGAFAFASHGGTALAHGTCAGVFGSELEVHGQHIVGDYVTGIGGISGELEWPPKGGVVGAAVRENGGAAMPGGPGPVFHFPNDLAPGASFCHEGHEEPPHSPNAEHPPAGS
jgi:hypothetical protein